MKHWFTTNLIRFVHQDLPVYRDVAIMELQHVQAEHATDAAWCLPTKALGVTAYAPIDAQGEGRYADPTVLAGMELQATTEDERCLIRELGEYARLTAHVSLALRLAPPTLRNALIACYGNGETLSSLPLEVHEKTFRRHRDYACEKIDRHLRQHVTANAYPFLFRNYPEIFSEHFQKHSRIRSLILVS